MCVITPIIQKYDFENEVHYERGNHNFELKFDFISE